MKRFGWILLPVLMLFLLAACVPATTPPTAPVAPAATGLGRILQRGELIIGTQAGMPPLSMTTKSGDIIGLDIDLCKFMAAAMQVELKVVPMPFQQLLGALEAGRVDLVVSGMTMTPERNLRVAFVGPYLISGKALLTKKKTLAKINNAAELSRTKAPISVLGGSTGEQFAAAALPNAPLVKAGNYDEAVDLVLKNKVEAMLADFPLCVISVARHPGAGLVSITNMLSYEPLGIAVSADDPLFLNWLENFLHMMKESGQLEALKARWFAHPDWLHLLP